VGSKRAANVGGMLAQPCGKLHRSAEEPHEQSAAASIVVHLATLGVACHAGGRGFEPRRSRSTNSGPTAPRNGQGSSSRSVRSAPDRVPFGADAPNRASGHDQLEGTHK